MAPKPRGETEAQFQSRLVDLLRQLGVEVLVTSARRFRAGADGKGYGADQGVPDLLVRLPVWPVGFMLGVELKGKTTAASAEQKAASARGWYEFHRTSVSVLGAVCSANDRLGFVRPLRIERFWRDNLKALEDGTL